MRAARIAGSQQAATPTFRGIDFNDRTAVLTAARSIEDLGIATYNGVAQYLTGPDALLAVADERPALAPQAARRRLVAPPLQRLRRLLLRA